MSAVFDDVIGPPRLVRHTWRCPCFPAVPETTHETETRELLGGMDENNIAQRKGLWLALMANQWFLQEGKRKKWVSGQTWVILFSCPVIWPWCAPPKRSQLESNPDICQSIFQLAFWTLLLQVLVLGKGLKVSWLVYFISPWNFASKVNLHKMRALRALMMLNLLTSVLKRRLMMQRWAFPTLRFRSMWRLSLVLVPCTGQSPGPPWCPRAAWSCPRSTSQSCSRSCES